MFRAIEWKGINDRIIAINPVKGHLAGKIEVSTKLIVVLNTPAKNLQTPLSYVIPFNGATLSRSEKKIAARLQNPDC